MPLEKVADYDVDLDIFGRYHFITFTKQKPIDDQVRGKDHQKFNALNYIFITSIYYKRNHLKKVKVLK